jgi:signal peptidase I
MSTHRLARAPWRAAAVLIALAVTLWWVRVDVIDTVAVTSESMTPTVCAGDRLLVLRAGAGRGATVGDLVTFRDPLEDRATLKRVVAVEGETVQMKDAVLYVDGRPVDEPYVDLATIDGTYFGQVTVPTGSLFVLGDEREHSIDSRDYGPIHRSAVDGRVLHRIWSAC